MDNGLEIIGGTLGCLVAAGILAAIIFALVYLVRKTKEEKERSNQEIQQLVSELPSEKQAAFLVNYEAKKKDPTLAVVLALLLGNIGIHKFYLGEIVWGIVYIVFAWTFIPGVIAFFEAFGLPKKVHKMNRRAAHDAAAILGSDLQTYLQSRL
jgi:TM2 domain-containing membrane protein YozV